MSNLEFWNKYKEVPQNALKEFNNGSFKGTDINTIWRMKCLTEEFGMCGVGWYYDIIKIWNEELKESAEVLTFAEIKLHIKVNNEWSKGISGVGGNKMLSYIRSQDYFKANDEATKMAVTDAIGNACRNLGIGADVYWDNDKTKYTDSDTTPKTASQTPKATTTTNYTSKTQTSQDTAKNEPKQVCEQCGASVNDKVANFSKSKFNKILCYECQKKPAADEIKTIEITDDDGLPF